MKTIRYSRILDLSHIIDPKIPLWPGDPPVECESAANIEKDGYAVRRFSMGEHSATHINAPNSFYQHGMGIDAYSAESLVVPAVVIDIRPQAATDPDYALTKTDVLRWEDHYRQIPAGSVVLLYTGWQEKWDDSAAFLNQDAQGVSHFPGFSGQTAQFLLQERQIAGVGSDTHGVDPGQDQTYATNKHVLAQQGIVLENLTHLDLLPSTGIILVIGILRLRDGTGSPVSVTAFLP